MDEGFVDLVLDLRSELPSNFWALHNAYWPESRAYFVQGVECTSVSALSFSRWAMNTVVDINLKFNQLREDFPLLPCFKHGTDISIEFMCLSRLSGTTLGLYYFVYCDMHTENKESEESDVFDYFDRLKNRICELSKYSRVELEDMDCEENISHDSYREALGGDDQDNDEFRETNFNLPEYLDDSGGLNIDFYFDMDSYISMLELLRFRRFSWSSFPTYVSDGVLRGEIEDYALTLSSKFLLGRLKQFYYEMIYNEAFRRIYVRRFPYISDPDLIPSSAIIGSLIPDAANYVPSSVEEYQSNYGFIYASCLLDLYCDSQMFKQFGKAMNDFRVMYVGELISIEEYPAILFEPFGRRWVSLRSESEGVYTVDAIDAFVYAQGKN